MSLDLLNIEDTLWVLLKPTRLPHYDFVFERYFEYKRPGWPDDLVTAVARVGAIQDYPGFYRAKWEKGVSLIHTPEEHARASQLPGWYPILRNLTPRSLCFEDRVDVDRVESELGWPVYVKGIRQTGRHQRTIRRIGTADALLRVIEAFREDPLLHWQHIIVREYVDLRSAHSGPWEEEGPRVEYRTFWWKGRLAGWGRFWWLDAPYEISREEQANALRVAKLAARRIGVTFLAVDVAQKADGSWIVMDCNDGQESGYTGISALGLWRRILELERSSKLARRT